MPVKNDPGATLLFVRQDSIVIRIQEAKNRGACLGSVTILENLNVRSFRNNALNPLCKLDWTVVQIITADKTADEPDHNCGSSRFGTGSHSEVGYHECGESPGRRGSGQYACDQQGQPDS
jgi:hypothetical protein